MKKRRKYVRSGRNLILAAGLGLLAACSSSAGGGASVNGGKANLEKQTETPRHTEIMRLLKSDCGACHGLTRQGGLGAAIRPQDLADKSVAVISEIILNGVPGTPMPPWRPYLTPDEARWLATALKEGRGLQ